MCAVFYHYHCGFIFSFSCNLRQIFSYFVDMDDNGMIWKNMHDTLPCFKDCHDRGPYRRLSVPHRLLHHLISTFKYMDSKLLKLLKNYGLGHNLQVIKRSCQSQTKTKKSDMSMSEGTNESWWWLYKMSGWCAWYIRIILYTSYYGLWNENFVMPMKWVIINVRNVPKFSLCSNFVAKRIVKIPKTTF